ncbi:MAG: hypothetical protein IT422_20615 [Pirellulaceae bacterium]|nr:hypothetical protein [Pirellulaceae bacterium]
MKIPRRLDEILPAAAMEKFLDVLQQPDISGKVREALHRVGLQDNSPLDKVKEAWQQARSWLDTLSANTANPDGEPLTLNASGQLLSSSLREIPLAPAVAYGYAKAATHYQTAASVDQKATTAVEHLLGRHASTWLGSTAEALRLLASGDGSRAGVVLSRVDAVNIAGVGNIHAMLSAGKNSLREIGAANGVSASDWQQAVVEPGQCVVLSSPNSLSLSDAARHRSQAIEAAHKVGAKVVEVLADGVLSSELVSRYGFPDVRHCLNHGADVVIWPLHLLLGGPSGALVIGDSELIAAVARSAESSGLLLAGANLSAATLALQLASVQHDVPSQDAHAGTAAQLLSNPENLKNRARRLAVQLSGVGEIAQAVEFELETPLGPSPWNRYRLQSWGVRLVPKNSLDELLRQVVLGEAKIGRKLELVREEHALLLNLRFISPEHDHELVQTLTGPTDEIEPAESSST